MHNEICLGICIRSSPCFYLNSNRCCILIFSIRCIGIFCFSFFLRIYGTIRGNTGNTRCWRFINCYRAFLFRNKCNALTRFHRNATAVWIKSCFYSLRIYKNFAANVLLTPAGRNIRTPSLLGTYNALRRNGNNSFIRRLPFKKISLHFLLSRIYRNFFFTSSLYYYLGGTKRISLCLCWNRKAK